MAKSAKDPQKGFTLDWYKELGWNSNPFTTENLDPSDYFLSGYEAEQQRLNYFVIESMPFGIISGASGTGKTLLLTWLAYELSKYKNRYRVVSINCDKIKDKEFTRKLIDGLLGLHEIAIIQAYYKFGTHKLIDSIRSRIDKDHKPRDSFYKQIARADFSDDDCMRDFVVGKTERTPLILILDDAYGLPKESVSFLRSLLDSHAKLRIVVAGTLEQVKRATFEELKQKDALRIETKSLAYPAVREMIKKRIEFFGGHDIEPFHDVELADLFAQANKNPCRMLELCHDKAVKFALKRMKERPSPIELLPREPRTSIFSPPPEVLGKKPRKEEAPKEEPASEYKINVIDRSAEPFDVKVVSSENKDFVVKEVRKPKPKVKVKKTLE